MFSKCHVMLFIILVTSLNVFAQKAPHLSLSPEVCMVENSDDTCSIDLNISWQLSDKQDVCVMRNETPLKCWQKSAAGKFSYKADVQFQTVYSLVNRKTGEVIATAKVAIQSSNTKSQRRRLRTPWSFF